MSAELAAIDTGGATTVLVLIVLVLGVIWLFRHI